MRVEHCSLRTEKIHLGWSKRFVLANAKHHPREMGAAEVEAFLSLLAVQGKVAASTQNQACRHKHVAGREVAYRFTSLAPLQADFWNDVETWRMQP